MLELIKNFDAEDKQDAQDRERPIRTPGQVMHQPWELPT